MEVLSSDAIETIERGWKRIVSELGIELLHDEARDRFRKAGQMVEGNVVRFDPDFLLEQVAKAPATFELQARDGERSLTIGGEAMTFVPIYGAPFVLERGTRRDATMEDFDRLVRLSQRFDEIDSPGGVICEPADRPLDSRHLDMLFSLITLSSKPFFASVISRAGAEDSVRMAEITFGGRAAIERRPAMLSIINANSPLRYDDRMLESLIVLAEAGQVAIVTPSTIMGSMAPVTLPASLAQSLAEAFSAIALIQLIRPGCPVVYGAAVGATDMRTGAPGSGGPEGALGLLCAGQLAGHYRLPWRGGGAGTTSQVVDAQAGYQANRSLTAAFQAGTNIVIHAAGAMNALLAVSYEKFIVDIELQRSLRVQFSPLHVDDESLAFDAHLEVGHGGHFFGCEHTLARFRDCFYLSDLSTTDNYERWTRNGRKDAAERAEELWRKALDEYEQPPLDEAVREELMEYVERRRRELGDA